LQTAGNAAIGFGAAILVVVGPILIKFLSDGNFSRTAMVALASVVGSAIVGVLVTYATKYMQARGSDVPPTVTPGSQPEPILVRAEMSAPAAVSLPAMPLVDPALLTDLVNKTLRDHLDSVAKGKPSAAIPIAAAEPIVVTPPPTTNRTRKPTA
jgi:hypothetical protein